MAAAKKLKLSTFAASRVVICRDDNDAHAPLLRSQRRFQLLLIVHMRTTSTPGGDHHLSLDHHLDFFVCLFLLLRDNNDRTHLVVYGPTVLHMDQPL